jgi:hypothetical protein
MIFHYNRHHTKLNPGNRYRITGVGNDYIDRPIIMIYWMRIP